MAWNVQDPGKSDPTKWTVKELTIHEETTAVEELNILPSDLKLLPKRIQSGVNEWRTQQVNLNSNWDEDFFYPKTFKWGEDFFYPKDFMWGDQEFYPKPFKWIEQDFYPQNHANVWASMSTHSLLGRQDFYPVLGGWRGDGFYSKNFLGVWGLDQFYSKNFLNVWTNNFYTVQAGWYVDSEWGEDVRAVRKTFKPFKFSSL